MLAQPPDDDGVRGSIVLMASVSAFDPAPELFGTHAYAAAKASIIGLTKAAAASYVGDGIRVNALAPATVATPMSRRAAADPATVDYLRAQAAARRRHARRRGHRRRRRLPVQRGRAGGSPARPSSSTAAGPSGAIDR